MTNNLIVYNLVQEIIKAKQGIAKNFLVIGKNLDRIQKEKLWKFYGDHLRNFEDFLKEINIKHATAYNCIRIWRTFGEVMTYKNLYPDYFRLVRLLPIVKEENKEEWLQKAVSLPPQGFNDEINEAKGRVPTDQCEHPQNQRDYYFRCKVCGKWVKIKE